MDENCHRLLQPLIPPIQDSISASPIRQEDDITINFHNSEVVSSNSGIVFRFVLIIFIGGLSIWANHEACKGHSITIVNEAHNTIQGSRFELFYASNGKASRLVYDTSKFVENFLYPNATYRKKKVNHIVLLLSSQSMMQTVVVLKSPCKEEYVLCISPSVMDEINHSHAVFLAVQKGMSRVWLWDGEGEAPSSIVNGIVEYISQLALASIKSTDKMEAQPDCRTGENPKPMAEFFNYCEMRIPGFIRRLNQELRNGWHHKTVDEALCQVSTYVAPNSSVSV